VTGCEDGVDVICGGDESCGFSVVGVIEEEDLVFDVCCYCGGDAFGDETWNDTFVNLFPGRRGYLPSE
jgi:hypothetical protein